MAQNLFLGCTLRRSQSVFSRGRTGRSIATAPFSTTKGLSRQDWESISKRIVRPICILWESRQNTASFTRHSMRSIRALPSMSSSMPADRSTSSPMMRSSPWRGSQPKGGSSLLQLDFSHWRERSVRRDLHQIFYGHSSEKQFFVSAHSLIILP